MLLFQDQLLFHVILYTCFIQVDIKVETWLKYLKHFVHDQLPLKINIYIGMIMGDVTVSWDLMLLLSQ